MSRPPPPRRRLADATGLSTLEALEAEGIHILREAVATARKPVILFSGGKDSVAVLHLATKAFWPGRVPDRTAARRHRVTTLTR